MDLGVSIVFYIKIKQFFCFSFYFVSRVILHNILSASLCVHIIIVHNNKNVLLSFDSWLSSCVWPPIAPPKPVRQPLTQAISSSELYVNFLFRSDYTVGYCNHTILKNWFFLLTLTISSVFHLLSDFERFSMIANLPTLSFPHFCLRTVWFSF